MSRGRLFDDGSIGFPRRGEPPKLIPGYSRDPGNPYTLRPNMVECALRQEGVIHRNCGGCSKITYLTCPKVPKISAEICKECFESGRQAKFLAE